MTIFIARHGETADNAARVIQTARSRLSDTGRAQAESLARRMANHGIVRIVSSDYDRALETASYVATAIGIPVEKDPLLRERDFGDLGGTPYAHVTGDPFAKDYIPPNGESWDAFHERVAAAWARVTALIHTSGGNLLVVTHGLVCRAIVERHASPQAGHDLAAICQNTALTEIEPVPPWRVRTLHCVAHLAGQAVRSTRPPPAVPC